MTEMSQLSQDYGRIEQAIQYLEENFDQQPNLAAVAASAGLSEFHFQRLFSRWVGISPKRFLQFLTKEYAKKLLEGAETVLGTAFETGLSGPGRLHDLLVTCEAVTPGEYKSGGRGMTVRYGFHPSPFGECLLAVTARGLCGLNFVQGDNAPQLVKRLKQRWSRADVLADPAATAPWLDGIFKVAGGAPPVPLHLYIQGTNFQIKVWEALLHIPMGRAVAYSDLARHIGMPQASRAVGNAVGKNPIPFLIPCHRVIRKMGAFGNYGEGPLRKKALLAWEGALGETQ